ncbi:hypothetical protein BROUX41_006028 [Berkeleyomyces rouxiae]|uniref:uncharacterized protein n=1 Tax=Berkeleyomyces rouxiae TaxID=2035830 RepID=UPI003B81ADC5
MEPEEQSGSASASVTALLPAFVADSYESGLKLACPYFQRNRNGPRLERSCAGPGFPTIPRLKEHLYRRHMYFICERCGLEFERRPQLADHQDRQPRCEQVPVQIDVELGFGQAVEKKLRAKKRNMQWQDIYQILFPTDELSTIPSPYYSTAVDDGIRNYQAYLERVTLDQLPQAIEYNFPDLDQGTRDQLSRRMPLIVNNILASASSHYVSALNMEAEAFQHLENPELHEQQRQHQSLHSVSPGNPVSHVADPGFSLWMNSRPMNTSPADVLQTTPLYPMNSVAVAQNAHLGRNMPEMSDFEPPAWG